jgi:hypothetical protein
MSTKTQKTIAKLAIVSKDFTTYYIPGKSIVQGVVVNQIEEHTEHFSVVDVNGTILTTVSKKVPFLAEYTDVFEVPDIEDLSENLVSFGNYIFKKYGVMVHSNDGENKPIYQRTVTHADICNWQQEVIDSQK